MGEASGAGDGLELATRLRPDVVMIDQQMPALAGVDALTSLRTSLPDAAIILATAGDVERLRAGAAAAGADVVLQKSGRLSEVTGAIRQLAEQRAR